MSSHLPWVPPGLLDLYRYVGPVSLPDIGNGYFIPRPLTLVELNSNRRPDRIDQGR